MEQRSLVLMSSSIAFFTTLYKLTLYILENILPDTTETVRRDLSVRWVNAIQGVMAVMVGLLTMNHTYDDIIYSRYQLLEDYLIFATTYFSYDTWAMYQVYISDTKKIEGKFLLISRIIGFLKEEPMMMIHHIVIPVIYGPVIVLWRNGKGDYLIGCAMLMEFTVPFIAFRFILILLKRKNSVLYIVNGVLLTISFGLCRIFLWFYMVYIYSIFKEVTFLSAVQMLPRTCICGTLILLIMNLYWFIKIVMKFISNVKELCRSHELKYVEGKHTN